MSELIEVLQKTDPGSALIELFELEITDTDTLYFHAGTDSSYGSPPYIQFDGNSYVTLPIEIEGMEYNSDGASNRPTLTVANLLNTFSGLLYDSSTSPETRLRNEDLIGRRITKRTTLYKYLDGQPDSSSPVVEFPKRRYYIDRIAEETKSYITFELAAPFDLSGVKLPGRNIVGKYCGWQYQGGSADSGCSWRTDSKVYYPSGTAGGVNSHKAYFTEDDIPIVPSGTSWAASPVPEYLEYQVYPTGAPYSSGDYVEHNNTVWKCVRDGTSTAPNNNSTSWIRGDVCGKKLSSCKRRFQYVPSSPGSSNQPPAVDDNGGWRLNTARVLPFGAFPGSRKFR